MSETRAYKTTATCGQYVAGQRIPSEIRDGARRPKAGHVLQLTDSQAKYELLQGSIERARPEKAATEKPAG